MNANQARQPTTVGQHPLTSAELLAELEESRNRRLDNELDQLADGFAEIIRAASVSFQCMPELYDRKTV
jgi:hypothetical protein